MAVFLGKDNFWNHLRFENSVKVSDIAKLLNCSYTTASAYFTGQAIPKGNKFNTLCEFFDVDHETGRAEFEKMYEEYWSTREHPGTSKKLKKSSPSASKYPDISNVDLSSFNVGTDTTSVKGSDKLLKKLYGNIPYDTYTKIEACSTKDEILSTLYNTVDRDVYDAVYELLRSK